MSDAGRPLMRPPLLRTRSDAAGPERRASYLELFFDLVFVVGVAQLAGELVHRHDLGGFGIFAGLFLVVFIAWQGFSFYADRFDTDDVLFRVVLLSAMLAIAALSVQIPDVAEGRGTAGFVAAYVVLRSLVIALYVRAWRAVPEARALTARYGGAFAVSVVLWLASLLVDTPWRFVLWAVGLTIEYLAPVVSQRLHARIPIDPRHVRERFALFTIIVLGESVVAVALGTASEDWRVASASTAGLGFVVAACLWWVYFDRGVEGAFRPRPGSAQVFTRIHIALLGALTAVGAGVHLVIEEAPGEHGLESGAAWALAGGAALYLATLTIAQVMTDDPPLAVVRRARVVAIAALLVLAALGSVLLPVSFTAVTAATLVALVVVEIRAGLA